MCLSGHEHNYDDVRSERFFGQTRRERRAYPPGVCEERATKSGRKRTAARRVAPNLSCGCVARWSQIHFGYAPSSRLATGQIRRNERHRSYVHDHLVRACFENGWRGATRSRLEVGTTRRPEVASNVAKRPSLLAPYWLELPLRFPSGESPDGTGESPVLPANPFSKHALRH